MPDSRPNPGRALFGAARRLRAALRAMDLDAAASASAECQSAIERLAREGPKNDEDRRQAGAAERVLDRCAVLVHDAQSRTVAEIRSVDDQRRRASLYAGVTDPGFKRL